MAAVEIGELITWIAVGGMKFVFWSLAVVLFALWWGQGQILYIPHFQGRKGVRRALLYNGHGHQNPAEYNMPYEDHYITTADGVKIHAWLLLQKGKKNAPTLIFFHGNAGNIGFRLPNCKSLFSTLECNILQVEYRGFGNSGGRPSERGLQLDAQASLDFLLSRDYIDPTRIFVFGRSLGGAVALNLAYHNRDRIRGVIVENTFTNIDDMVVALAEKMRFTRGVQFLRLFIHHFMTSHWYSDQLIPHITAPILFLSGMMDELVPPAQMQRLHDLATQSKHTHMFKVPEGEHNDTYVKGGVMYYESLHNFITHCCTL